VSTTTAAAMNSKVAATSVVELLLCSAVAATLLRYAAAAAGHKLFRDRLASDGEHRARLLRLTRSVDRIVNEYAGTRPVVMFAHEVRRSELGQRLLADMDQPRLLVSPADLRLANGLIVYLQRRDDGRPADYGAVLSRLPSSDHSRHMVLWDGGQTDGRVDLHRIQMTFETFWQYQLIDVAVLVPMSTGSIRVYAFNPYTGSRCNKAGPPIMINVWSGWTNAFLRPHKVFGLDNRLKDLHKYAHL